MDSFRTRCTTIIRLFIASGVALWSLAVGAPGAAALSCADPGVGGVAGLPDLIAGDWFGTPFFESFDLAITGTVTAIATVEDGDTEDYGRTTMTFEVIDGYGTDGVPESMEVTASDPGWLAGFPYRVGTTYFVPLLDVGPQGEPNYSFVCDPILEMTIADADELPTLVADSVAVSTPRGTDATPGSDAEPDPTPPVDPPGDIEAEPASTSTQASESSGGINRTAAVLVAIAVVISLGVVGLWRYDRSNDGAGI